jgi:endonuclease/exonuclease/phosphatase family metal-dependent hydrolase
MLISLATYNIHKGVSQFFRASQLRPLRQRLSKLEADLVFLQEVCGASDKMPGLVQYDYLAKNHPYVAYGKNAVTRHGHHGNALLSRYPIIKQTNENISAHRLEQRGVLHCVIQVSDALPRLHCLNVHLGLLASWRRWQLQRLVDLIAKDIPNDEPLLIAGDFNDWNRQGHRFLSSRLDAKDVFSLTVGKPAKTFPSFLPLLPVDRVYVRGLKVRHAAIRYAGTEKKMSDHAAITAQLELDRS